jgi:L-ascorbate metabolism protein UlaG (beta-lactamase superfamily)
MDPNEIAFAPDVLGVKGAESGVKVRWLGTAGFELTCDEHTVLFDPYLTRASLARCVASPLRPDEAVLAHHLPRADAIVLGHTHFDHALDAPSIAKRTGARVFGSKSAAHLCRAAGVPDAQIDVVEGSPGAAPIVREVGPFRLIFHPSAHSPLVLGRIPFEGEITDCDAVPQYARRYLCGAVFGVEIRVRGISLFHVGSAEVLASMPKLDVDLALLCVAGWTATESFPERMMRKLSPRAVLLSHWDNFLLPLTAGARPLPALQTGRLIDRLAQSSSDVMIGTLPLLGHLKL